MLLDRNLETYLEEVVIPLRIGCVNEGGWPMVLSLWYLFEDGHLYCATTESARVVRFLRAEPRCSFEISADQPPYCGVRGRALAVVDGERGQEILMRLLNRYLGGTDSPLAKKLLARSAEEVAIRLEPQWISTWNFTSRMAESVKVQFAKVCPD